MNTGRPFLFGPYARSFRHASPPFDCEPFFLSAVVFPSPHQAVPSPLSSRITPTWSISYPPGKLKNTGDPGRGRAPLPAFTYCPLFLNAATPAGV